MSFADERGQDPYQVPRSPFGPPIRFDAIGEAWRLFKAEAITWLTAGATVVVCNWIATGAVLAFLELRGVQGMQAFRSPLPPLEFTLNTVVSSAVNGFFLGGMFRMACLQVRGKAIKIGDFLGVVDVFFELIAGAVLYAAICLILAMFCVIPGLIAAGLLMFTIPLIVDGRLTVLNALRRSFETLRYQWLTATIFHLTAYFLAGLGACCFWVGLLFTMPLYSLSIAVLYRDFFLNKPSRGFTKPASGDPYFQ